MREVESLSLVQANELLEYWSEHPPVHVLLTAMMRAKPLRKKTSLDLTAAVMGVGGAVSSTPNEETRKLISHSRKESEAQAM